MKTVTRTLYVADDGTEHKTEELAEEHNAWKQKQALKKVFADIVNPMIRYGADGDELFETLCEHFILTPTIEIKG